MLAKAIEATRRKWQSEQVHTLPGACPAKIALFETTYRVTLPADLKTFFSLTGGMGGTKLWEEDSDMVSFWPLPDEQEIRSPRDSVTHVAPLPTVWRAAPETLSDYFVLGDWSIMAFVFCARLPSAPSETTEIYFYDGSEPMLLYHTLQQFLDQYVQQGLDALFPSQIPPNEQTNVA
jgi:hypothetical protein